MKSELEIAIELLKKHLTDGWSIGLALKKANIPNGLHLRMLKDPFYMALVKPYYQKNKSLITIYVDKTERNKKYLRTKLT